MSWRSAWWRGPRRDASEPEPFWQRPFIAVDLETTGLDPRHDRIVSLAAVTFVDGEPGAALVTLVNPGRPIPASSTAIHGIDDAMVADAPDEAAAVGLFDAYCAARIVVGHGIAFDLAVLGRARSRSAAAASPVAALCTKRLAAWLHPAWSDVSLDAVAARFDVVIDGRHTARGDAVAAGRLLVCLLPRLRAAGIRTLAETLWAQEHAVLIG